MVENPILLSVEDYLALERASPIKHEYRQGRMYEMVGFNKPHAVLTGNLACSIGNHLQSSPCMALLSRMKVRLEEADCYYYPDVVVICEPSDLVGDEDFVHFPKLLVEVMSPSTAKFDQGEKFTDYQTCPTLEEYILVSQTERAIEVRSLIDGVWQVANYQGEGPVTFHSIGWTGSLADLYHKVTLLAAQPELA
jgi:Uma2 family endonuclease